MEQMKQDGSGQGMSLRSLIWVYLVCSVLLVFVPGLWILVDMFEEKVVSQRTEALQDALAAWTARLDLRFNRATSSIRRFSDAVSSLQTPGEASSESTELFDRLIRQDADGSWRSDRQYFSPATEAGIWLQPSNPLSSTMKRFYMEAKKVTEVFGQGALAEFEDTWILPRTGGVIVFWPSEPDYVYKATSEFDYTTTQWVTLTNPNGNPEGSPQWTQASYDPTPGVWMISIVAPYFQEGQWAGAVGHDLPLTSLAHGLDEDKVYPGVAHFVIRRDGLILVSDRYAERIKSTQGKLLLQDIEDQTLIDQVNAADSSSFFISRSDSSGERIILVNRVPSQDWLLVSIVPRATLLQTVQESYRAIKLLVGLAGFLFSLVPALVLSRLLLPQINSLLSGIRQVSEGNLDYHFTGGRSRDFRFLAEALNAMAASIKQSIREIKGAEEALRESEEQYRQIFEFSIDALYVLDLDGIIREVNAAACKMHGCMANELVGSSGRTFVAPESLPQFEEFLRRVGANESFRVEGALLHKNGARILVEVRGALIHIHGTPHLLGVAQDITKRKQAEADLAFKNVILSTQQETSLDGILVVDQKGRILSFNQRFLRMWGIPTDIAVIGDDELALQLVTDRVDDPDRFLARVRHLYAHHDEQSCEELALKDGRIFERFSSPMMAQDGKYLGRVWYFRDITDRKKAEQERANLEVKLRQAQKMEAIGTLAGGIAHDFNNILSGIFGYTALAEMDLGDPIRVRKDLKEILRAAGRARDLVRQILTFSRETEQVRVPLQMSLVVKEALKLLRSTIPTTIHIRRDIQSQALILADPTEIHQVLMNLCTNAYHAMRETGGTLGVMLKEVGVAPAGAAGLPNLIPGRYLQLEVSDTGHGMDAATIEKIFEPYFTTKGIGEGTGLGLAVVHGIIQGCGGAIQVDSEPGLGTTFHVYFPIVYGQTGAEGTEKKEDFPEEGAESILVVDDDPVMMMLFQDILERRGYAVTAFSSGGQALQEFQQAPGKYDLLITDMCMPHITGTDLAQQILGIRPDLPIILCTGNTELINREKALAAGIREYCEKPLAVEQLLRTVRRVLDEIRIRGLRVLCVDDERIGLELGQVLLEQLGLHVAGFLSALEALATFRATPEQFDIIITDFNMPDMDGFELARQALALRPDIPIVLASGVLDHADAETARSIGIRALLEKPWEKEGVTRAIAKAVAGVSRP